MGLKRIDTLPTRLPHARIYLDDVEEISRILQEAVASAEQRIMRTGASTEAQRDLPKVRYTFRDREAETVNDLLSVGGSTSEFRLTVGSFSGTRVAFDKSLNPEITLYPLEKDQAWAVYGRVKSIFDRRQLRLKNAISDLSGFSKTVLWVVVFLVLPLVLVALAARLPALVWALAGYGAFVLSMFATDYFRVSKVYFVASHDKDKAVAASRRQYLRDMAMMAVGALIAALTQSAIRHFFK